MDNVYATGMENHDTSFDINDGHGSEIIDVVDTDNVFHDTTYHTDDFTFSNGEDMLAYQDPLAHSTEFKPDSFSSFNDTNGNVQNSFNMQNDISDATSIGYLLSPNGGLMPDIADVDNIQGVKNGMLSDSSQLQRLIELGEIQGSQYFDSDDIGVNEEAQREFLHRHGYTMIPAGYKIHYIVPLTQGGADDPQNMILLNNEDFDEVARVHQLFYGRTTV